MPTETTGTVIAVADDESKEQPVHATPAHKKPERSGNGMRSPESRHYRVTSSGQAVVEPGALKDSPAVQEMVRLARELVQKTRAREAQKARAREVR